MDTITLPPSLLHVARRAALRLRRIFETLRARRAERATRLELASLDEGTLRDLGFVRSEAGSIAAEAFGRVPRSRQRVHSEFSPW